MSQPTKHTLIESVIGTGKLAVKELFSVKGWVAVVTGGGTGLGLVTAAALVENGAKVYITGRRTEYLDSAVKLITENRKEGHGSIEAFNVDCSTKEGIAELVKQVSAKEKFINLLVNNHGVSLGAPDLEGAPQTPEGISKVLFDQPLENWTKTYTINTTSYYYTTVAFLPLLSAAKSVGQFPEPGNVINLGSMSGLTVTSQRGQFEYNASKAATISLSHQLATEFARRQLGIRVNVICPGYFSSGMTPIVNDGKDPEGFWKAWGIPFGRGGNAEDYAQAIFGLCANQYVTGTELIIDGGWLLQLAF
ncbi:hypothetical protein MNV49_006530 [Pseudohyphozyma bogoriensis]|nr:hypothetical protein MNV49_006530 [Pseudohyphozyma bogoriensis]